MTFFGQVDAQIGVERTNTCRLWIVVYAPDSDFHASALLSGFRELASSKALSTPKHLPLLALNQSFRAAQASLAVPWEGFEIEKRLHQAF